MSSAHDAHAAPAHAHDDHEVFDGEPTRELSPGEPRSPAWLPALGAAIFAAAAVYMLTGNDPAAAGTTPAAKTPTEAAPTPPQPAQPAQPVQVQPAQPQPAGSAQPGDVRKLSPDQVKELQKKIEEARAKGALPTRPTARPAAQPRK
jgi:hypothetical protein